MAKAGRAEMEAWRPAVYSLARQPRTSQPVHEICARSQQSRYERESSVWPINIVVMYRESASYKHARNIVAIFGCACEKAAPAGIAGNREF